MTAESRLRRALTDADWSLPNWPSTSTQLQRAARRRVRIVCAATVSAIAALTAGIVVPHSTAGGSATRPGATGHHHAGPHALPSLGSPGFPVTVYPAPGKTPAHAKVACPSLSGVDRQPPPTDKAAYRTLARDFGQPSFTHDLQRTDRSLWPKLRHEYSHLSDVIGTVPIGPVHIQSILPLRRSGDGPSAALDCGSALVRRSVELSYDAGPQDSATAYALQRAGHLLLWGRMPYVGGTGADPYEGERGSQRYVHRHPPQCGNVFGRFSVGRSGPTPSVTFVAHTPTLYFRCALLGPVSVRLASPGEAPIDAKHVGTAHQVILRPGQSAQATLQVRRCSGPKTTYQSAFVTVDHNHGVEDMVSIRVGHCGADIGPIAKR
jgi:hypothetical protein